MKKFTKLISLLCLAAAFVLASCSSPSSGGNPGGGTGGGRAQVSGKIGKYGAPYVVGDIVFKDGSATPYAEINDRTTDPKITDVEKAAAIAVIFYVGTGLNSDVNGKPNNTISRTLGVGLKHDRKGLKWCRYDSSTSYANGYSTNIETIQCTTTIGDKNGSDNLEQIGSFLGTANNDTTTLSNYPAFKFGKEYGTTNSLSAPYNEGWYLPSLAELYAIYNVKTTVDAASELCGGSQFGTSFYWSSSQSAFYYEIANLLNFADGDWDDTASFKHYDFFSVCAVRAFN